VNKLVDITLNRHNLKNLEGRSASMFRATRKSLNLVVEFETEAACAAFYETMKQVVEKIE